MHSWVAPLNLLHAWCLSWILILLAKDLLLWLCMSSQYSIQLLAQWFPWYYIALQWLHMSSYTAALYPLGPPDNAQTILITSASVTSTFSDMLFHVQGWPQAGTDCMPQFAVCVYVEWYVSSAACMPRVKCEVSLSLYHMCTYIMYVSVSCVTCSRDE